jgi:hypothetical protein
MDLYTASKDDLQLGEPVFAAAKGVTAKNCPRGDTVAVIGSGEPF